MLIVMLSLASAFSDLLVPAGAVVGTSVIIEICRAWRLQALCTWAGESRTGLLLEQAKYVKTPIANWSAGTTQKRFTADCTGLRRISPLQAS